MGAVKLTCFYCLEGRQGGSTCFLSGLGLTAGAADRDDLRLSVPEELVADDLR